VRISGSNAGYTMFRGSVKGTGYRHLRPTTFQANSTQIRIVVDTIIAVIFEAFSREFRFAASTFLCSALVFGL